MPARQSLAGGHIPAWLCCLVLLYGYCLAGGAPAGQQLHPHCQLSHQHLQLCPLVSSSMPVFIASFGDVRTSMCLPAHLSACGAATARVQVPTRELSLTSCVVFHSTGSRTSWRKERVSGRGRQAEAVLPKGRQALQTGPNMSPVRAALWFPTASVSCSPRPLLPCSCSHHPHTHLLHRRLPQPGLPLAVLALPPPQVAAGGKVECLTAAPRRSQAACCARAQGACLPLQLTVPHRTGHAHPWPSGCGPRPGGLYQPDYVEL